MAASSGQVLGQVLAFLVPYKAKADSCDDTRSMAATLATLMEAARQCKAAAASFSVEHAAEGLSVADELRALFLPSPASASSAQAAAQLLQLPTELLSFILSHLDTPDLACLAVTCRSLWLDAPTAPPPPCDIGLVEAELRRRAKARGLHTASLPLLKGFARG